MTQDMSIYLVASESGHVKIGISRDVARRVALLQREHPWPLKLFRSWDGMIPDHARRIEERSLWALADRRVLGEWVRCLPEEAAAVIESTLNATSKPEKSPDSSDVSADQLKQWRTSRAMSQETAAEAIGISLRQYSRYETGRAPIPIPVGRLLRNI